MDVFWTGAVLRMQIQTDPKRLQKKKRKKIEDKSKSNKVGKSRKIVKRDKRSKKNIDLIDDDSFDNVSLSGLSQLSVDDDIKTVEAKELYRPDSILDSLDSNGTEFSNDSNFSNGTNMTGFNDNDSFFFHDR